MWKNIELKPRVGLFLMKSGVYIKFSNISQNNIEDVIGICLNERLISSIKCSEDPKIWSSEYRVELTDIDSNWSGIDNTKYMINYCIDNNKDLRSTYPAAYYCTSYSPGYRDGDWYLPSERELRLLYNIEWMIRSIYTNFKLMESLYKVIHYYSIWSSSSHSRDDSYSVCLGMSGSRSFHNSKSHRRYVIPFLIAHR